MEKEIIQISQKEISNAEREVIKRFATGGNDKYGRFFLAAISSIPWILPLSLIANLKGESDQEGLNNAFNLWLKEHEEKIKELINTVNEILDRLSSFRQDVQKRIESKEYIALVKKSFRVWDQVDTPDKRQMIKKLLIAAGAITLCPDDQIRLFIDWIEGYHESHFAIMKEIYVNGPISNGEIWDNINPGQNRPKDNSADAKLFSYFIRELNLGGIIERPRDVNDLGQRIRSPKQKTISSSAGDALPSIFDESKDWILSELGKEFIQYVMQDVDLQLAQ